MKNIFLAFILAFSTVALASDRPGGLSLTAASGSPKTYSFLLSPAYTIDKGGAFLTAELRYQINEDFAIGGGFGAGEAGFNLGPHAVWYILPDTDNQPAVALLGGVYVNRIAGKTNILGKLVPVVSKEIPVSFGKVSPYGGLHLSMSDNWGVKTTAGVEFLVKAWGGMKLSAEVNLALANSVNEIVFGVSYPFTSM